jgi:hypothetical protein
MREDERRRLLVIEQNLIAEAPELARLFDPPRPARRVRRRRAALWLITALLPISAALADGTVLVGALALLAMTVVRWTAATVELDGPRR